MRTMSRSTIALQLAAAVSVALFASACARGVDKSPEARLGKPTYDQNGGRYGRNVGGMGAAQPGSTQEFSAQGADLVYFASDSSELTPEAQQTLAQQAQWLQRYQSHTVTIEGHADERGTREYNIALGARRAQAVKRFLEQNGVNPARVRTTSYGKERPVAVCNDISCWSQNRRAQTVLAAAATAGRY